MAGLEILYQDNDFVAVNKPSGMLVHRTNLAPSDESIAALQLVRDLIGRKVFPVHRLDRPTSGVLIFALSSEAANSLSVEFAEKRVVKKYLAVVRGRSPAECVVDHPLREELDKIADRQARVDKPAQEAVTDIRTLATVELPFRVDRYPTSRYSLVCAVPRTGRKHQIRRHLKHLNHPIIGDVNHGVGKHNRLFREQFACGRLLLACTEISFVHPFTGVEVVVRAPLTEDYSVVLQKLGWGEFSNA